MKGKRKIKFREIVLFKALHSRKSKNHFKRMKEKRCFNIEGSIYRIELNRYVTWNRKFIMTSLKPKVLQLYKNLLFMGRDYPLGYEFFRSRCRKVFLKNSKETNPEKINQMINHGKYIMQELEAMYKLKKYRTLKHRYYKEEEKNFSEIQK